LQQTLWRGNDTGKNNSKKMVGDESAFAISEFHSDLPFGKGL